LTSDTTGLFDWETIPFHAILTKETDPFTVYFTPHSGSELDYGAMKVYYKDDRMLVP
jgi:hypothetical protein